MPLPRSVVPGVLPAPSPPRHVVDEEGLVLPDPVAVLGLLGLLGDVCDALALYDFGIFFRVI